MKNKYSKALWAIFGSALGLGAFILVVAGAMMSGATASGLAVGTVWLMVGGSLVGVALNVLIITLVAEAVSKQIEDVADVSIGIVQRALQKAAKQASRPPQ